MEPTAHQGILTVGHSNHPVESLIALLKMHAVQAVADVRSSPYSRYHAQFNRGEIEASLHNAGIAYEFFGDELGARPPGLGAYRNGHIDFRELAASPKFEDGLRRLILLGQSRRVAVMCAERDPLECHRMILVGRALSRKGVPVKHILPDGRLESNEDAERRLVNRLDIQGSLFEPAPTAAELIDRAYEAQGRRIAHSPETSEDASVPDSHG